MTTRYRILSLDGGGIRGLLASRLLERLSAKRPGWMDSTDLLAGTSTGAILAAAVAAGLEPGVISRIYAPTVPRSSPTTRSSTGSATPTNS